MNKLDSTKFRRKSASEPSIIVDYGVVVVAGGVTGAVGAAGAVADGAGTTAGGTIFVVL